MSEVNPDFITSVLALGIIIIVVSMLLFVGGLIERWVARKLNRPQKLASKPDPSTQRYAEKLDTQARYIRRMDRQR